MKKLVLLVVVLVLALGLAAFAATPAAAQGPIKACKVQAVPVVEAPGTYVLDVDCVGLSDEQHLEMLQKFGDPQMSIGGQGNLVFTWFGRRLVAGKVTAPTMSRLDIVNNKIVETWSDGKVYTSANAIVVKDGTNAPTAKFGISGDGHLTVEYSDQLGKVFSLGKVVGLDGKSPKVQEFSDSKDFIAAVKAASVGPLVENLKKDPAFIKATAADPLLILGAYVLGVFALAIEGVRGGYWIFRKVRSRTAARMQPPARATP